MLATKETKCIDDELPFTIPDGWEWCRLGSIGSWGSGATPAKGNTDYYFNGSIPWLTTGELNDAVVYDTRTKVTDKALAECSLRMCEVGDVLIAMYGATIGKVAIAGCQMTTNQACCACTPHYDYNKYLFYFLMANKLAFTQMGEGGAQPNISKEKIVATLIPVPPYNEQKRIVERIETLLPYIDKYTVSQVELDKLNNAIKPLLKKSILQEAIQGRLVPPQVPADEPASVLLEKIAEEKQRLVKEGLLKKKDLVSSTIFKGDDNKYYEQVGQTENDITDEIPFDLPDSWKWVRLGGIVKMTIGKTPARGDSRYWSNAKFSWVAISDMADYSHIKLTKERISEEASKNLMGELSPAGTLIMSFKLTVGRTSILDISSYHNEAIVSIFPFIDVDTQMRDYLFYVLPILANLGDSKDAIKGKTLNSKSLNNLLIPLPPFGEQRKIVNRIVQVFDKIKG